MNKIESYAHVFDNEVLYDVIFLGIGASNSLILLSLLKTGYLKGKKVAILEPSQKNSNDKTYCFWASPKDAIVNDLNPVISHCYTAIEINQAAIQNIEQQPYYYVKSIDLYAYVLEVTSKEAIPIFRVAAETISAVDDTYSIDTSLGVFKTRLAFDSRPQPTPAMGSHDIHLNQSFYGLHIRCEKAIFSKDTFEMMNFDVDQHNFTQFIYTLPFSSNEAIVELTRFGSEKIDLAYAKQILDEKISASYGNYEILADETGCIPMSTYVHLPNSHSGILNTGISANLIKPSTGYGFKNMYAFANKVSSLMSTSEVKTFNKIALKSKERFRFYDTLLLIILLHWPQEGKKIFTTLFRTQNAYTIFSFLDEKTSIFQEIKIFVSLPIPIFIRALWLYVKQTNYLRYVLILGVYLIYHITTYIDSNLALNFGYTAMALGLFLVGIPHGAVDYLQNSATKLSLFYFIIKYLLIVMTYFILWQYFPLASLILFVAYSAFHFGESEMEEVGVQANTISKRFNAFLLGLSILSFIIFTHFSESLDIISRINGLEYIKSFEDKLAYWSILLIIGSLCHIVYDLITKFNTNHIALLSLLILGLKLPLIFAFGLYFIGQHSYNAWRHTRQKLSISDLSLYQKALPYTIGALMLFILVFINSSIESIYFQNQLANFFIFLACLSLPHVVLMHLFYGQASLRMS